MFVEAQSGSLRPGASVSREFGVGRKGRSAIGLVLGKSGVFSSSGEGPFGLLFLWSGGSFTWQSAEEFMDGNELSISFILWGFGWGMEMLDVHKVARFMLGGRGGGVGEARGEEGSDPSAALATWGRRGSLGGLSLFLGLVCLSEMGWPSSGASRYSEGSLLEGLLTWL